MKVATFTWPPTSEGVARSLRVHSRIETSDFAEREPERLVERRITF
jgi:hypothetical protein